MLLKNFLSKNNYLIIKILKMENLTPLSTEEMNQTEGGSFVGFALGFAGYLLERAAESIAAHPVGGPRHYEI
jgi:hypothetical protein